MVNISGFLVSIALVGAAAVVVMALIAIVQFTRLIQREDWRIKLDLPDIAAYTPRYGYRVGDTIPLFVHASGPVDMAVFRLGAVRSLFRTGVEVPAIPQNPEYDVWNGCDWRQTAELPTDEWPSGLYVLEFSPHGHATTLFCVPLLLTPTEPCPVAVVCSTNTWNAYNAFGGLSNYVDSVTPRPLRWAKQLFMALESTLCIGSVIFPMVPLPRQRPNIRIAEDLKDCSADPTDNHDSHLLRSDWNLIAFLEQERVNAAIFDDEAWERQEPALLAARLIIFQSHSEYWTETAITQLKEFRERGGSIAFLSGNNCWREIVATSSGHCVVRQSVPTSSLARILGAAFDKRGFRTWAPYEVIDADHWTLSVSGLRRGELFGTISANCGRVGQKIRFPGASGREVDKINQHSQDFSLIASGRNPGAGASMVCHDSFDGSFLFNAASITFNGSLQLDSTVDGIVRAIVRRAAPQAKDAAPSPSPRVR